MLGIVQYEFDKMKVEWDILKKRFVEGNQYHQQLMEDIEEKILEALKDEIIVMVFNKSDFKLTLIERRAFAMLSDINYYYFDEQFNKIVHFKDFSIATTFDPMHLVSEIDVYLD